MVLSSFGLYVIGASGRSLLTTTQGELAWSIELSVGLKQPSPQTIGVVGLGVAVGVVNPSGSPIAVGVGMLVALGVGVGVSADAVPKVVVAAITAENTRIKVRRARFSGTRGCWRLGWNTAQA